MIYSVFYSKDTRQSYNLPVEELSQKPGMVESLYVYLKDVDAVDAEDAYFLMQAEIWSPNGEARELLLSCNLGHTSMCIGDVVLDPCNNAHMVASIGWISLPEEVSAKFVELRRTANVRSA